jgi:hypothetical protein
MKWRRKEWWEGAGRKAAPDAAKAEVWARRRRLLDNALLMAVIWGVGVLLLDWSAPQKYTGLAAGQRAPATVVATVDFDCVDLQATEEVKAAERRRTVPVYRVDGAGRASMSKDLGKLVDRAEAERRAWAVAHPEESGPEGEGGAEGAAAERESVVAKRLEGDAKLLDYAVDGAALAALFAPGREREALGMLEEAADAVAGAGIAGEAQAEDLPPRLEIVRGKEGGSSSVAESAAVAREDGAKAAMVEAAAARLEEAGLPADRTLLAELLWDAAKPNLELDEALTEKRAEAAAAAAEPIQRHVRAGTTLMEERETVTPQMIAQIEAHNRKVSAVETHRDRRLRRVGDAALILIVLVVCVGWLQSTGVGEFADWRRKGQLVLYALSAEALASLWNWLAVGLGLMPGWVAPFAVPMAFIPMLAALTLEPAAALAVGLWSGLSTAMVFDRDFEVLLMGLGGAALAVALLQGVRKRSQVMRAGFCVGVLQGLIALSLGTAAQHTGTTVASQVAAGFGGSLVASLLALLCLPWVEWAFQRTTDISLLEYADLSHPLLRRMAMEAPGTYHHSLMVSAIGRAAAEAVGADGLLVTVCAGFHDIGKLSKPEFFTENQTGGRNPHDDLAPAMSTLVIQSHVKEGVALAKRNRLPREVVRAIASHHGTTLTSYFYQVAKKALAEEGLPEDPGLEHSFRYEGPRPSSREEAILMLADTVEAASRSLEKPTPGKIADMVDRLVREKTLDGQLDECPLTLRDMERIRASFKFSLTNILHGRSPYPRENPDQQPPAGDAAEGDGSAVARGAADGESVP